MFPSKLLILLYESSVRSKTSNEFRSKVQVLSIPRELNQKVTTTTLILHYDYLKNEL